MGVIRKKNPKTGKWEVYGSTDAKDINLIDINNNYTEKNVESALREISTQINEHNQLLSEHSENIEWLKEHGGIDGLASKVEDINSFFAEVQSIINE